MMCGCTCPHYNGSRCGEHSGNIITRSGGISTPYYNRLTWTVGHSKPSPSKTASTIPAVNDEQLSWLMSRETEMCRSRGGSLSMIMSKIQTRKSFDNGKATYIHHALFDTICWFPIHGFPN